VNETVRSMIRCRELAERFGVHRSTILRWAKKGQLPRPVPIGDNIIAFYEDEVVDWVQKKEARLRPPEVEPA
jgi:excisionase family DNA binding protein